MRSKKIKYFLFLILIFASQISYATYGCYLSARGNVYTQLNVAETKYKKASDVFVGYGACLSGPSDGSCIVNYSPNEVGVLGDYDVLFCPLDSYIWILLTLSIGLVLVKIFSKKSLTYIH
jgi:hypothetical protein